LLKVDDLLAGLEDEVAHDSVDAGRSIRNEHDSVGRCIDEVGNSRDGRCEQFRVVVSYEMVGSCFCFGLKVSQGVTDGKWVCAKRA